MIFEIILSVVIVIQTYVVINLMIKTEKLETFIENFENQLTQSIEEIKEMTNRLCIEYDILSDLHLDCTNKLSLPTFSIKNKTFIKRLTLIVEKNIIKQVFYPIVSIDKHINEVMEWLKKN